MKRIDSSNKVVDLFGPGKHGFGPGIPESGIRATYFTPVWCNDVQEEISNVIELAGFTLDGNKRNQLYLAIQSMFNGDMQGHLDDDDPHQQYSKKGHRHTMADVDGLENLRMYRPAQMVAMFCDVPPTGTLVCNGGAISRTLYADLFAAIGTKYGPGDGATTFNVPNLTDGLALLAGGMVGEIVAGSVISHLHAASASTSGKHQHGYADRYGTEQEISNGTTWTSRWTQPADMQRTTDWSGEHLHTITVSATGGVNNLAAGIKLLICIAY